MLPKYDLTPVGVQQKLTDVYALSDPALVVQANSIKADFVQWLDDNFNVTATQETYLDNLEASALSYYGDQMAVCFVNRLAVYFSQEPAPAETEVLKLVRTENTISTRVDDSGGFVAGGSFIFKVVYEPL